MGRREAVGQQNPHQRRARWSLLISIGLAGLLGLASIAFLPNWMYPPPRAWQLAKVTDPAKRIELVTNSRRLQNDARTTMLQGFGGIAVLVGAIVGVRQLRLGSEQWQGTLQATREQLNLAHRGQITERFTRAIDQLGSEHEDVRVGAIFALEHIARDSTTDRSTVLEVLEAYVRSHALRQKEEEEEEEGRATYQPQSTTADVRAALAVLCCKGLDTSAPLDLSNVEIAAVSLHGAQLESAKLIVTKVYSTDLGRANLRRANLAGADLDGVGLEAADLAEANLLGCSAHGANLRGANLEGANLHTTSLIGSALVNANLRGAKLQGTFLHGADLTGADLAGADFNSVVANGQTRWPVGFDPRAAHVRFLDIQVEELLSELPPWMMIERLQAELASREKERKPG